MSRVDRIATDHYVQAAVAADTVGPLIERVTKLLSYGRRMALAERYTWVNDPPSLYAGLTVVKLDTWAGGIDARLTPGIVGFGFSLDSEGDTEEDAWKRYHAGKADSPLFAERRRNVTIVEITGGVHGPGPGDQIIIRPWNDDGVCHEHVIVFETKETV